MNKLMPIYCLAAYTAIASHLAIIGYKISGSAETKDMIKHFTPKQMNVYNDIRKERRTHYLLGVGIGLIIATTFIMKNKIVCPKKYICAFIGLALFVGNIFYELMPKSQWMIEHLDNAGDVQRWNSVYKKFRMLTGYGELLGFVLFAIAH